MNFLLVYENMEIHAYMKNEYYEEKIVEPYVGLTYFNRFIAFHVEHSQNQRLK
jgi:hypothetical protein